MKKLFIISLLSVSLLLPLGVSAQTMTPEYRAAILQLIQLLIERVNYLQIQLNLFLASQKAQVVPIQQVPSQTIQVPVNTGAGVIDTVEPCTLSVSELGAAPDGTMNFSFDGSITGVLYYGANIGIGNGQTEFRYLPFGTLNSHNQVFHGAFYGNISKFKMVLGGAECYMELP